MRDSILDTLSQRSIAKNRKRIAEILELRAILEPEIAARAAGHIEPRELERLKAVLDGQEQEGADPARSMDEDLRFHLALARAGKNEVIVEVVAVLHELLGESRVPPLQSPTRKRLSLEGHRRIYEAVAGRDPEASREAMRRHLKDVEASLAETDPHDEPA
jgi:GntR family transcriptional repressor for pyruvate dehydrogenase complex